LAQGKVVANFSANTGKPCATPTPRTRENAEAAASLTIEHHAIEKNTRRTDAFQSASLCRISPVEHQAWGADITKIAVFPPAEARVTGRRSRISDGSFSGSFLPTRYRFSLFVKAPLSPASFLAGAVFFCFSAVFLRLEPPLK